VVITAALSIPTATHCSLVLMRRSRQISASSASVVAAVTGRQLWYLSAISFPPFLKWRTQPLIELIYMTSSSYQLLKRLWTPIGPLPSAVEYSVTPFCMVRTSTTSDVFRCHCVQGRWLAGAPMIPMELDSVAIRWVRQETLTGAIFKRKNMRAYLRTDFSAS